MLPAEVIRARQMLAKSDISAEDTAGIRAGAPCSRSCAQRASGKLSPAARKFPRASVQGWTARASRMVGHGLGRSPGIGHHRACFNCCAGVFREGRIVRYVVWLVAFICSCVAVLGAVPAHAEKRAALVIGNSAYQHTRALPNPKNDAEAIAKLLAEKGFDVTLNSDLDYRAMRDAVRAFASTAREADVALVYYSGHGIEIAGENYLVPIDAKLVRDSDLEYESVTLASVLSATANARRLRVVVLDACRNNPLGERIVLGSGVTRSVTRGLARIEPRGDMLVAYAARAGTLAQDGAGRHSPYADALLKHMGTPGLDVRLMFGKVRDQVLAATRQEQEPFIYGSLTGDVIALVPGKPATSAQQVELVFWSSVKDSNSPAVLATYLERCPSGEFAPVARALIEHYDRQNKLDLAVREGERKRQEEAIRAEEAKRLEDQQRAREAALAEVHKRAEEAKNIKEAKRLEAELLAR